MPATSQPTSPDSTSQAISLRGLNDRYPLSAIIEPENIKIAFLYRDSVTKKGNKLTIELSAAPPAKAATTMGKAQQIKVPDEENKARTSIMLFLFTS
ncbi:MAG: hypothetical protein CBC68_04520 [Candidatus Marinimicrobia bacterium TMED108]|nr:MAG: hypothetical protein CBC68_04520 [Candidatus Marinimicrobia bacterium TMED108]